LALLVFLAPHLARSRACVAAAIDVVSYEKAILLVAAGAEILRDDMIRLTSRKLAFSRIMFDVHGLTEAKKTIRAAGVNCVRARATEILVALRALRLDSICLLEIVVAVCAPYASMLPADLLLRFVNTF
jgi:acyl carrier protein